MKNAGFSLLETLVALAVFSIASVALSSGVLTSIRANSSSDHLTQATILAQDKLESLLASAPNFTSGSDTPRAGFSRTWTIASATPHVGVAQIDVAVSWSDPTSHTITMTTVVNE